MYVLFSIVMKNHSPKWLTWLRICFIYWFWTKFIILLLLHLSHHLLKKRLVLGKLFDKSFNDCLKFEHFLFKMFTILSWNLGLKFLNFHHIFHWNIQILKVYSSLLRIYLKINKFSLSWLFTIKAFCILINPGIFLMKARFTCNTKTINDKTSCSFVTPLAMMKWYFVGLLHLLCWDWFGMRK